MRSILPQRPLTGPEIVGVVVVAFMVLPFLIGGFLSLEMAFASWPAAVGAVAGIGIGLLTRWTLSKQVIANRRQIAEQQQRIDELERENATLERQVRMLDDTVDRYIEGPDPS